MNYPISSQRNPLLLGLPLALELQFHGGPPTDLGRLLLAAVVDLDADPFLGPLAGQHGRHIQQRSGRLRPWSRDVQDVNFIKNKTNIVF